MSGPLENYTAQGAPYTSTNFIFFGDDTSSARASVQLTSIQLSPVPELPPALLLAIGLLVIAWRRLGADDRAD